MANKLIILVDLGEIKAYKLLRDELSGSTRLELMESSPVPESHERLIDKVTDLAGRFPVAAGTNAVGASIGENHNLKTELQKRTIRTLAERINRLVRLEKIPMWFLAAAREINQRVVDQLDPEVRAKMKKNVGADLIKADTSELMAHFA